MRFQTKIVQVAVFMCLSLCVILAEDIKREEADNLLRRAQEASCTMGASHPPYEESGTLTFLGLVKGDPKGTLRKQWADQDNFIEEIREGDYQQLVIRKDGKRYRHQNATFTPLRITQLWHLMPPCCVRLTSDDIVRKLKNRRVGDRDARCIEYDTIQGHGKASHEVCIDKATATTLSYGITYGNGDEYEYLWNNYGLFDGKLLPHHAELNLRELGVDFSHKIIDANFDYISASLTPASIVVPDGMQQEPVCRTKVPPSLKSAPDPSFPVDVPRHNTKVVLRVILGPDGMTHDSQILQTGGRGYDEAAQEAVRRWMYMPELCDGQPQETQLNVEVDFRLR
jgi:TonB family protein